MRQTAHRLAGALFVLSGAAWSPWAFDRWIGSGTVDDARLRAALAALAFALALFGLAHFVRRPTRAWMRADAVAGALFVALPLAGEATLRAGIALGSKSLRSPALYADPNADADYWKLRQAWFGEGLPARAFDAELGWAMPVSEANPLGVVADGPYPFDPHVPAVIVFGDSFIAGPVPTPDLIPQLLDRLLPELPVYNYGMGGYGVDQICLRLERALPQFEQPIVLVGIFTPDLDRTILPVRTGQKPYMAIEAGKLVVRGLPVDPDVAGWRARHPAEISSYFAARLVQWYRLRAAGGALMDGTYRRAEKLAVNRAVVERIVRAVRERGRPLYFVLFDPHERIGDPRWRERFLRETLAELDVPWLDAGEVLRSEAAARGLRVRSFFRPDNHPTAEANAVIARELAARLRGFGWVSASPSSR